MAAIFDSRADDLGAERQERQGKGRYPLGCVRVPHGRLRSFIDQSRRRRRPPTAAGQRARASHTHLLSIHSPAVFIQEKKKEKK